MPKTPIFADTKRLSEDQRITLIGRSVMDAPASSTDRPLTNAFIVEEETKADRYIRKLKQRFPGIRIIDRLNNTPSPGLITVKIGPPLR